ncbi:MAG TPA: sigma 54-interacting transcriptional regulator [Ktedonobacteraceae bacterium]|nr:sigma 54-interacting transcriptional regulator [Ktedonobacteraceae bacterium]
MTDNPLSSIGMVVGRSQAMRETADQMRQVAAYPDTTVLLQGESGTGKDVAAHAIHALSRRAAYPFVDINCAALPDTLLETELFGVEAGAFTDARVSRDGYLFRADGGTLFLDEIGSMPLLLQAKLLRFLETRSFRRVGSTRELHVNLRVISATNIDLATAVARRTFRDDLYYRLQVITLRMPPLRERPEDIEPLIEHFLRQLSPDETKPLRISDEAMELLLRYAWPGNTRELRSIIQRGQIVCDEQVIRPADLPGEVREPNGITAQQPDELQKHIHLPPTGVDLPALLGDIERRLVQEALEQCHGNQVQAAALLGLSRDQLRYRMRKAF